MTSILDHKVVYDGEMQEIMKKYSKIPLPQININTKSSYEGGYNCERIQKCNECYKK